MIKILKTYNFEGPYYDFSSLKEQSGVYVILENERVIDVGESESVRSRIINHDRANCWKRQSSNLSYAVYYVNEYLRMDIEKKIRTHYRPPCGDK